MSFAVMDEKQCSDRALEAICIQGLRRYWGGHRNWPAGELGSAHYRLCLCNHKAGAWKMHANLADLTITASDHDLMDLRGDQFTDNRVASGIVRRDGNGLARFPTDGILRIDGRPGDRCGIPCYIKRLLRAYLASPAL